MTDFVQEVQVKTSRYNAEFPGATGGVVNAITKSGSNVFRVDVGTYYTNNEALKGAARPTLRLVPTDTTKSELIKLPLDDIPEWEPVLEGSGPVVRNKAWFYVGYAPVRAHTTRTVTFRTAPTSGSATQSFTQDTPSDRVNATGTWQIVNSMRAKFTYGPTWNRSRGSLPGIEPDGTSTSNPNTIYGQPGSNSWNNTFSGMLDWVLRPNWFVNLSGGYFMTDVETIGSGTEIRHQMDGNISVFPNVPADLVQPNGYIDTPANSRTTRDQLTRSYVNATSTWYLSGLGQRSVKAGVRFERIGNDRLAGQVEPTITFFWDQTYAASNGVESRGPYGYYRVTNNVLSTGDIHSDNWGFFVQDAWSPAARLTINAGVRVESEQIPFYTPGQESDGIKFGFGDKIAPRIGFAWDIKGDGNGRATPASAASSTSRSWRCRAGRSAASSGTSTSGRSTRSTGRASTVRKARRAARAGSSRSRRCGSGRTKPTTPRRSTSC